ncbi:MAG: hypothetical protein KatS3mg115_2435 [Candidatus Poribacteria bacterium]|nr:MAG: hypothetical protein KatS3mg115_2435 [Candidatus Poribacteria bacterium]
MTRESSLPLEGGAQRLLIHWNRLRPERTGLLPPYPNPFNPEAWIPFQLVEDSEVTVEIYDMSGELVRRLPLGRLPSGFYTRRGNAAYWDGRNSLGEPVASGLYLVLFRAGSRVGTRRILLLK